MTDLIAKYHSTSDAMEYILFLMGSKLARNDAVGKIIVDEWLKCLQDIAEHEKFSSMSVDMMSLAFCFGDDEEYCLFKLKYC